MRTSLEGKHNYIILIFIGITILLFLLPVTFSIPLWSQNSTKYSTVQSYSYTKVHGFQINWTDSVGGVGAISNVTFESNFSTVLLNYTIGVNISGNNNTTRNLVGQSN